jgi:hypothetical protein
VEKAGRRLPELFVGRSFYDWGNGCKFGRNLVVVIAMMHPMIPAVG